MHRLNSLIDQFSQSAFSHQINGELIVLLTRLEPRGCFFVFLSFVFFLFFFSNYLHEYELTEDATVNVNKMEP